MTAFHFPEPGERQNAAAIPVPEPTLAALYALAIVGARALRIDDDNYVAPQCSDALDFCVVRLGDDTVSAAIATAETMEAERDKDYPF